MQGNFDGFDYAEFLRQRWRVVAFASLAAVAISLGVSLILPKRYTASASIVIDPPGGLDSRTATAVSPVYLESLKAYERFAESDSLFAQAAERFHLDNSVAIESLKQRVLKVTKLRDTKILVIEVTLSDARLAHGVAEYLAQETVELNRAESRAADGEQIAEWDKQAADARLTLERARQAWAADAALESADSLQADLDDMHELQYDIRGQSTRAQADAAEYRELARTDASGGAQTQSGVAAARAAQLEIQSTTLARAIAAKAAALSARRAEREKLQRDLDVAQTAAETSANRLRDLRATIGGRSERLSIIDPGIVPQRIASPNIVLNVIAAWFLSVILSIAYLSLAFAYQRRAHGFEPALARTRRVG